MKKKRKGFTLAELLIVVAIIAVLVAIGIPIFTSQLEKAEKQPMPQIYAQYAQAMAEAITVDGNNIDGKDLKINLRQKQPDWQTETILNSLGNSSLLKEFRDTGVENIMLIQKRFTLSLRGKAKMVIATQMGKIIS